MKKKNLSVTAICEGTVIDHITVGQGLRILRLLCPPGHSHQVTVGLNLKSSLLGLKDLIKIESVFLTPEQRSYVALFAPQATINVIRDCQVVEKSRVVLPAFVSGLLVCPNRLCITNTEQTKTYFSIRETNRNIVLCCRYCEKNYHREQI